jgi:glycosyltransferase involved in cell wall biosynthesis
MVFRLKPIPPTVHGTLPLVSIIMPTFNHALYIRDAIESVLRQTYRNWELIIVNNYSKDDTKNIVGEYLGDRRIRIFDFRNNGIIAASRNFGIRAASGDMIAFLDSDDLWLPEKLESQISFLATHPRIDLVCSNGWYYPRRMALSRTVIRRKTGVVHTGELVCGNPVVNSSVLVRAGIVRNLGPMSEDPFLRASEDYEYWIRMSVHHDGLLFYDSRCLISYRVHDSNVLSTIESGKMDTIYLLQRKRVFRILSSYRPWLDHGLLKKAFHCWVERTQRSILEDRLRQGTIRVVDALRFPAVPSKLRVLAVGKSFAISIRRALLQRSA